MSPSIPTGLASSQLTPPGTLDQAPPAAHDPPLHTLVHFLEHLCGRIALHFARHATSREYVQTAAAQMVRQVLVDRPLSFEPQLRAVTPTTPTTPTSPVAAGQVAPGAAATSARKKPRTINVALARRYDNAVDSGYSTDGSPPSSPVHVGKKRCRRRRHPHPHPHPHHLQPPQPPHQHQHQQQHIHVYGPSPADATRPAPAPAKLPLAPRIRVRRIARHPVLDGCDTAYLAFRQIQWKTNRILHLDNNHAVFSVLSWNALSPKYCTLRKFPHMQPEYSNWDHRRTLLMCEILFYEPDVVCLQEIEHDDYADYFDAVFHAAGYMSVYDKKRHDYIMDGCATFYKASRFELVAHECLHYNAVDFDDNTQTFYGSSRHAARACRFDLHFNLAQIVTLKNRQTRALVRVVNTHLLADPLFADAKLLQAALLVDRLVQLDRTRPHKRRVPNVVCGDLNSVPSSAVVQYLTTGKIHKREFLKSDFGRFTSKRHLLHHLSLSSTYDACDVAFTTRSSDFTGCVDYILYSDKMMRCIGVLGDLETKGHMWMPNELCPSDHIPMYCVLQQLAK